MHEPSAPLARRSLVTPRRSRTGVAVTASVALAGLFSAGVAPGAGAEAAPLRQVALAALDSVASTGPAAPGALVLDEGIGRGFSLDTLRDRLLVFDIGPSFLSLAATVALGPSPTDVAVDTTAHRVVVSDDVTDTVSVIDGGSAVPSVVATIPTGSVDAEAIAVDGATATVYVANLASDDVTVLHLDSGTSTRVPVGDAPADVAVDPSTHIAYVAEADGRSISTIVGDTPGIRSSIGSAPRSLTIAADRILVATDDLGPGGGVFRVQAYDRDLRELGGSVNLGARASGVAVDTQLRIVFVRTEVGELRTLGFDALDELGLTPPPLTGGQPRQVTVQQSTHRLVVVTTDRRTATLTLFGVAASPEFVGGALAAARVGAAYREKVVAVASPASVSYAVRPGDILPPGIVLDGSSGELRGTPRVAGSYDFSVTASNGSATTASRGFKIIVAP
ncbi:putative Ig domain-containing protein [Herbiconiux sp. A18JL235]|uniref:Ig domain-containing protein n=1 Tax=Herbiconiux sp. A18JL235 TaxID=3152363 RepID=A0AB39BG63_9MICO